MRHETGFRVEAVSLTRLAGMATGTRILTGSGSRSVESLKRGEWVVTREGRVPVIAVEARSARVAPVRVVAEALGLGMPAEDLLVGPATRLWLPRQSRPIEAFRLVDGVYVTEERPRGMTLWTLVVWGTRAVRAEGVEVCV
ncbi:hypothetical protein Rumeso_01334 [Rubellimicrobium mesophilum DSM 19309]|uniref:Hedgehog/Intein (Hint) domain-containing protein n=1 Tax=Rubellimicrobium mesophilum DSM 19309 TaxID=442562 RepID=A0A017HRZ6_9RHOB|nr:Hint domain-containing protein [Rubellimicrobium mesophilum]EYD77075.1 hypothetical protein Rumeso_01334 [Rubellimicrobium mesophilum DSM 19309]